MSVDPPSWRGLSEFDKASLRWAQINAEKRAAGCPCGHPATEVEHHYGNIGSVPVETWTCVEHKGASGWTRTVDGEMRPTWARSSPCASCTNLCARGGPINGPITTWYCPDREVHDA